MTTLYDAIWYGIVAYAALMALCKFLNVFYISGGACHSHRRLEGKIAIVTGSNTGVGKETAKDFACRGATVILACRSKARALPVVKEIIEASGNPNVAFIELDLASLASVRAFVDAFVKDYDRLDILVNNAAVMSMPSNAKTVDGFEMQMGVNHLGHFLLTNLLLPQLRAAPEARIVTVSSLGHIWFGRKIDPNNLMLENNYERWTAYGNSKMANVLFTKELARRESGFNIKTYCVHPGGVHTDLTRNIDDMIVGKIMNSWWVKTFTPYLYFWKTSKQGAQTSIYCAVDEKCQHESGLYYADAAEASPAPEAHDTDLAKRLWTVSERLVGLSA